MNKVNWTTVLVTILIVLVLLVLGSGLLGSWGYRPWGYGGWGMMGPGMMGGMFFMWLIPLGLLVLTVLGVVWLVQTLSGKANPPVQGQVCPSCGRGIQSDWKNCPYCGTTLGK
jgi:hypothetical protein